MSRNKVACITSKRVVFENWLLGKDLGSVEYVFISNVTTMRGHRFNSCEFLDLWWECAEINEIKKRLNNQ